MATPDDLNRTDPYPRHQATLTTRRSHQESVGLSARETRSHRVHSNHHPQVGGSFTETVNVDEECDRAYGDLQVTTDVSGTVRIVQRGPHGPEVFSMNRRFRTTWTNSAGQSFTERGTLLDKDLQWIDNGDGTGTLIVLLTGGYVVKGSTGVIAADPGQTRIAVTCDADGNLIDEQVVKGSTGRNDDSSLCDKLAAVFG